MEDPFIVVSTLLVVRICKVNPLFMSPAIHKLRQSSDALIPW